MADVWLVVCCFLSFISYSLQQAPTLTSINFEDRITRNPHFVMFYGPWCEHCKNMMPAWDALFNEYHKQKKPVNVVKVDCTADVSLCAKHNIKAYPTLRLYYEGALVNKRYNGKRTVAEFTKFISRVVFKEPVNQGSVSTVNNVKILTNKNFDEQTELGVHFVKFYAPWCIHCIKLAPIWESLATKYKDSRDISIAKLVQNAKSVFTRLTFESHLASRFHQIDCTAEGAKCNQHNVKAFPTLKLFKDGKEIKQYTGGRALRELETFVTSEIAEHSTTPPTDDPQQATEHVDHPAKEKPLPPAKDDVEEDLIKPYQLNKDNFEALVSFGTTFVKFYAPWCVHCRNLAPTWEQLAKKCAETAAGPKIARVDCTAEEKLCQTFGINGYPTLTLFKDGQPKQEYNGNRDLESLYRFVMQHHDKEEL